MLFNLFTLGCVPEEEPRPQIAISSTDIDFGEVPVGSWMENGFIIENTGAVPVQILSSGIVGASEDIWSLTTEEKDSVNPGEYVSFIIRFTPNQMRQEDVRVQIRLDMEELPTLYVNGFGEGGLSVNDRDEDGFSPAAGDCNDANPDVNPDAQEICDGLDNDCDGVLPDEEEDVDGDGWMACPDAAGNSDCDDLNNTVYPTAPELCDGLDNDCDNVVSDTIDLDGDGQTTCDGDCDDQDADRWLGNTEGIEFSDCDYKDNDCNGLIDDIDNDNDGHSICPSGGDCDDGNPFAYPVVFDSASPFEEGDGSPAYPYKDLTSAIANIDELCQTVMVKPGTHEVQTTITAPYVQIIGAGQYAEQHFFTPFQGGPLIRPLTIRAGANVIMKNITFFDSTVNGTGGAIFVRGYSSFNGENINFWSNSSTFPGGAVSIQFADFECSNCEFSDNSSVSYGGAIYAEPGNIVLDNPHFSNNVAQQGAAVGLATASLDSTDGHYEGNFAVEGGAIILAGESVIHSTRDVFWENQADASGGAISMRDLGSQPSIVVNAQFQDNVSLDNGGAISASGNQASFLVANSTFVDNYAVDQGGDIFVDVYESTDGVWVWGNLSSLSYGEQAMYVRPEACSDPTYLTEADCLAAGVCADASLLNQADCEADSEIWTAETWAPGVNSSFSFNSCHYPSLACYQFPSLADEGFNDDQSWFDTRPNEPAFVAFDNSGSLNTHDLRLQSTSALLNTGPFEGMGPSFFTTWNNADGTRNHRGHSGGPNAE